MTFRAARTIDDIYEAVRSYDRVIAKDAPLADALNYRLDTPRLETFASTPRGLVYRQQIEADLRDRRELFLAVLRETDLTWKEAFYYLSEALNCWEESGALDRLSEFEVFQSVEGREIIGLLGEIDSVFLGMQRYEPDDDGDVMVLQLDKLTPLDRNVLPDQFDTLDLLTDEPFEVPSFHVYPSTTSLIENVTRNVSVDNARDVAVVVEQESQYQPLLEAEFQKQNVPYMHGETLTQDEHFRTLFKLMRSAFNHNRMRVRDVMPILHRMKLRVPLKYQDAFLSRYDHDVIRPFRQLMETVPGSSFDEVLERYEDRTGVEQKTFRSVLEGLGFLGRTVDPNRLNQLEFFLSNFDEQTEKEEEGVLFASPKAGAYVDRPMVFYLGMDASWTRTVSDRPWIDHDRHRSNNLTDFQVLLQNGERQYYLVQEHQMNADVTPCFYFNVLFDEDFEVFSDADSREMSGLPNLEMRPGFDHDRRATEDRTVEAFSQSALNRFVKSPRDYFFDQIVPTTENVYMRKGQVFHDFAEFYVNHPDVVEREDRGTFVDVMEDALFDLADEFSRHDMRTEFEVGIENIIEFLEHEGYDAFEPSGYDPDRFDRENFIADEFGDLDITNPISEAWFEDPRLGVHGLVDFIPREDTIVDFKSGSRRNQGKIVRQADPDRFEADPDFQVILYLLYHRNQYPDRTLQFTFFYFLENLSDVLGGEDLLNDTLVTVNYFPRQFAEQVPKKTTFEYLISGNKKRKKTLEGAGYDAYRSFFEENPFPDFEDRDKAGASGLAERYAAYNRERFKEANYVTDQSIQSFKELVDYRRKHFFEEDLDRFQDYLRRQLDRLNRCIESGFPIENDVEDLDLDDLHHRDLIVDDRNGA